MVFYVYLLCLSVLFAFDLPSTSDKCDFLSHLFSYFLFYVFLSLVSPPYTALSFHWLYLNPAYPTFSIESSLEFQIKLSFSLLNSGCVSVSVLNSSAVCLTVSSSLNIYLTLIFLLSVLISLLSKEIKIFQGQGQ